MASCAVSDRSPLEFTSCVRASRILLMPQARLSSTLDRCALSTNSDTLSSFRSVRLCSLCSFRNCTASLSPSKAFLHPRLQRVWTRVVKASKRLSSKSLQVTLDSISRTSASS